MDDDTRVAPMTPADQQTLRWWLSHGRLHSTRSSHDWCGRQNSYKYFNFKIYLWGDATVNIKGFTSSTQVDGWICCALRSSPKFTKQGKQWVRGGLVNTSADTPHNRAMQGQHSRCVGAESKRTPLSVPSMPHLTVWWSVGQNNGSLLVK